MKLLVIVLMLAGLPAVAQAPPSDISPEIEQAARKVGKSLRCVVCQNQSIEESSAPLAADMRRLVRERMTAGESRDQVLAYMTDRYGNFVRMQPPLQLDTLLLWFGPLIFVLAAAVGWFAYLRPGAEADVSSAPLSEAEGAELERRLETRGHA